MPGLQDTLYKQDTLFYQVVVECLWKAGESYRRKVEMHYLWRTVKEQLGPYQSALSNLSVLLPNNIFYTAKNLFAIFIRFTYIDKS